MNFTRRRAFAAGTSMRISQCAAVAALGWCIAFGGSAYAGEADVIAAKVRRSAPDTFSFDVTVKSNDKSGRYFADWFEVLTPDRKLLARRELLHDHADEQPFSRDLSGVKIPPGIDTVIIRAHHNVKGYDGKTLTVRLPP